jgi:hypothetical protein
LILRSISLFLMPNLPPMFVPLLLQTGNRRKPVNRRSFSGRHCSPGDRIPPPGERSR